MDPFDHVSRFQSKAVKLGVLAVVVNLLLAGGLIAGLAYAAVWVAKELR